MPPDAKLREELTDEERDEIRHQGELERIARLTADQREKEKQNKIKETLAVAARIRSQYEIEGRENPLDDSKKWFTSEVEKINNLYS